MCPPLNREKRIMKRIILASVMFFALSNAWAFGSHATIQWSKIISCTEGLSLMKADSWSGGSGHVVLFEPSISDKAEQSLENQWGDYIDLSFVYLQQQDLNYYVGHDGDIKIEIDARNFKNIAFKISDATTGQNANFIFKSCH